jgi:hypothetical protein
VARWERVQERELTDLGERRLSRFHDVLPPLPPQVVVRGEPLDTEADIGDAEEDPANSSRRTKGKSKRQRRRKPKAKRKAKSRRYYRPPSEKHRHKQRKKKKRRRKRRYGGGQAPRFK